MRQGPEHRQGWRKYGDVEGVSYLVEAQHRSVSRIPKPHEMARQMSRGVPAGAMVQDVNHEWSVVANSRRICTLRQEPSGNFSAGSLTFPRMDIMEAAAGAIRRLNPGLIAAAALKTAALDAENPAPTPSSGP